MIFCFSVNLLAISAYVVKPLIRRRKWLTASAFWVVYQFEFPPLDKSPATGNISPTLLFVFRRIAW